MSFANFQFEPQFLKLDLLLRYPIAKADLSRNQQVITDLSQVIAQPPANESDFTANYLQVAIRVAALLGVPSNVAEEMLQDIQVNDTQDKQFSDPPRVSATVYLKPQFIPFPYGGGFTVPIPATAYPTVTKNASRVEWNSNHLVRNGVLDARNNVFAFMDKVSSFVARAQNAGFSPPDNPFTVVASMASRTMNQRLLYGNAGNATNVDSKLADDLVYNMGAYVDLIKAEAAGQIDLSVSEEKAAQLSSVRISMDGYGSNGNVATDLMRFLPNAQELQEAADDELLAAFDFRKRLPKILFTVDYEPDDSGLKGCIIGWKKIADASGYVLHRRNILDNTEAQITVSNTDIETKYAQISDYVKNWVMTFYDTVDESQIFAYLDTGVPPDGNFFYTVQAYQVRNDSKDHVFNVETVATQVSPSNRARIEASLRSFALQDFRSNDPDSINPWPMISKILLGDSRFDWILAGVNCRASMNRNDPNTDTRRFSYLGARISHLIQFMDSGKFVMPKNVNDVAKNVSDSITNFGLSQTITEVLHETGVLYYFEGTPPKPADGFNRAGTLSVKTSPFLSAVIAAVDPDAATLDLKVLGNNLPMALASSGFNAQLVDIMHLGGGAGSPTPDLLAQPTPVNVPDLSTTTDQGVQGDIQFLSKLSSPDSALVDLTTFDGISTLVRTIRIFTAEGPNRGGGDAVDQGVYKAPPFAETVAPPEYNVIPAPVPSFKAVYVPPPPPAVGRISGVTVGPPPATRQLAVQASNSPTGKPIFTTGVRRFLLE